MPQHDEKLVMWEAHEYVGLSLANVGRVAAVDITPEMWAEIEKKAAAEGMDPVEWFDLQVERLNAEEEEDDVSTRGGPTTEPHS